MPPCPADPRNQPERQLDAEGLAKHLNIMSSQVSRPPWVLQYWLVTVR